MSGFGAGQTAVCCTSVNSAVRAAPGGARLCTRQESITKQQHWLLFLRHCSNCKKQEHECCYGRSCTVGKGIWDHVQQCKDPSCTKAHCTRSKTLVGHFARCVSIQCPLCCPVKEFIQNKTSTQAAPQAGPTPFPFPTTTAAAPAAAAAATTTAAAAGATATIQHPMRPPAQTWTAAAAAMPGPGAAAGRGLLAIPAAAAAAGRRVSDERDDERRHMRPHSPTSSMMSTAAFYP